MIRTANEINNEIILFHFLSSCCLNVIIYFYFEYEIASLICDEDKHNCVYFDEISNKILRNILNQKTT